MMKYSVFTKSLYTEQGQLLKKFNCPIHKKWHALSEISVSKRHCDSCAKAVIDTAFLTEESVVTLLQQVPDTCLKVCKEQKNVHMLSPVEALMIGEDLCEE